MTSQRKRQKDDLLVCNADSFILKKYELGSVGKERMGVLQMRTQIFF